MTQDDAGVAGAEHPGGGGVVAGLLLVGLGAHVVGQLHPAEGDVDGDEPAEAGFDQGGHDDDEVEEGDVRPDLDHALHQQIEDAAVVAHGAAEEHAEAVDPGDEPGGEDQRVAKAVDQAGEDVAVLGVGAKEVPAGQVGRAGLKKLVRVTVFDRAVGHEGQEHKIAARGGGGVGAQAGAQVAVVRLPIVIQAEGPAGQDAAVGGKKPLSLVADDERALADEELRHAGEHDEPGEQQKRPVAAPQRAEAPELFAGDRIEAEGHETAETRKRGKRKRGKGQLKRMRGSRAATRRSEIRLPTSRRPEERSRMPSTTG